MLAYTGQICGSWLEPKGTFESPQHQVMATPAVIKWMTQESRAELPHQAEAGLQEDREHF